MSLFATEPQLKHSMNQAALAVAITLGVLIEASHGGTDRRTLASDSEVIEVYVEGDASRTGTWPLSPEVDPDVILIRSKLPYESKRVTLSSEIDTLSLDVTAGNEYDLTVLLNGETPCNFRIVALADPLFWSYGTLVPVVLCVSLLMALLVVRWRRIRVPPLLFMGLTAPVTFWIATLVIGSMIAEYDHFGNVISELGVIRSDTEVITSYAFLAVALQSLLFSAGFYKTCRARGVSTAPAWLSLSMPIGIAWAALFPLGNELHGALGPLPLAMNLGALLAFVLWRKHEGYGSIRVLSLIAFLLMMLLFLVFARQLTEGYAGLVQRFWYLGWSVWSVGLGVFFLKPAPRGTRTDREIVPA